MLSSGRLLECHWIILIFTSECYSDFFVQASIAGGGSFYLSVDYADYWFHHAENLVTNMSGQGSMYLAEFWISSDTDSANRKQ